MSGGVIGRERPRERRTAMVFGGGNALGAYHGSAYEALESEGSALDWVVGASVGAVTAAIIAGNPPETRAAKLREFWSLATQHTVPSPTNWVKARQLYNGSHALMTLITGRPGIFGYRFPGLLSVLPWMPNDVSLYNHRPLLGTLQNFVDFDRLNGGEVRLTVACADPRRVDRRLVEHAGRLRGVRVEPVAGNHPDAVVLPALCGAARGLRLRLMRLRRQMRVRLAVPDLGMPRTLLAGSLMTRKRPRPPTRRHGSVADPIYLRV